MSRHRKQPTSHTTCKLLANAVPKAETPGLLRQVLSLLLRISEQQIQARRLRKSHRDARDAFRRTLRLDDNLLDDIGVTREEVEWAATLPLEVNASRALYARAAARRRRMTSQNCRGSWTENAARRSSNGERIIAPRPPLLHPHRAPPCRF